MKYLNSYRIFESQIDDDTRKTIEEICYDITDEGFNITINRGFISRDLSPNGREISYLQIDKRDYDMLDGHVFRDFKYLEVKDVVDRIVNYLGSRFVDYFIKQTSVSRSRFTTWPSIRNLKNFNIKTGVVVITFDEGSELFSQPQPF